MNFSKSGCETPSVGKVFTGQKYAHFLHNDYGRLYKQARKSEAEQYEN